MEGVAQLVHWPVVESKLEHLAEARPDQLLRLYQDGGLMKYLLQQQDLYMKTVLRLKSEGMEPELARETALQQICDPAEIKVGSRPLGAKVFQKIKSETLAKLSRWNSTKLNGTPVITA